jgi:hypothetical protein
MIENANILGKYQAARLGQSGGMHSLQAVALRRNGGVWPVTTASLPYTANLFAHFDADDGATIFDSNSGGSATTNGGAVGRWEDKSANGRHLVQATANNRPLLRTGHRVGRSGIEFDGTNDGLAFVATLPSACTVFHVISSSVSNKIPFKEDDSNNYFGYIHTSASGGSQNSGTAIRYFINGAATSDYDWTPETRFVRFHTFSNGVVTTCIRNLTLNTWSGLSLADYASFVWSGFFYELIIYSESISDANRALVEAYLMSKWRT